MAFTQIVKKAFTTEDGAKKLMRGMDMMLEASIEICGEYEDRKRTLKASHPTYSVFCKEQTEFALAIRQLFEIYSGMKDTVVSTRKIEDEFEQLCREAKGLSERWERELAKAEGRPYGGMDEESLFAPRKSAELAAYGIE